MGVKTCIVFTISKTRAKFLCSSNFSEESRNYRIFWKGTIGVKSKSSATMWSVPITNFNF